MLWRSKSVRWSFLLDSQLKFKMQVLWWMAMRTTARYVGTWPDVIYVLSAVRKMACSECYRDWLTCRLEKVLTARSMVEPRVLNIPLDHRPSRFENRSRRVLVKLPRWLVVRFDSVIIPQGSSGSWTSTTADRSLGSSFGRTRLCFSNATSYVNVIHLVMCGHNRSKEVDATRTWRYS